MGMAGISEHGDLINIPAQNICKLKLVRFCVLEKVGSVPCRKVLLKFNYERSISMVKNNKTSVNCSFFLHNKFPHSGSIMHTFLGKVTKFYVPTL